MAEHCEACGGRLWSELAKAEGIHPDCKFPDFDAEALELEERLSRVLTPTLDNRPSSH